MGPQILAANPISLTGDIVPVEKTRTQMPGHLISRLVFACDSEGLHDVS